HPGHRHGRGGLVLDLDLDGALVEPTVTQQSFHALATLAAAAGQKSVEEALLGMNPGAVHDLGALLLFDHHFGCAHQVTDYRVDVAAHVTDFGELRGLDL